MFLKIMSDRNLGDHSHLKEYTLIEVSEFKFQYVKRNLNCLDEIYDVVHVKDSLGPDLQARVVYKSVDGFLQGECFIPGNVYILNNDGKTIDSWAPNSY